MTRVDAEHLASVMTAYTSVPETPARPTMSDWRLARDLLESGVPVLHLVHAIRLATLRRNFRDPESPTLARVHSLAYYKRTLETLEPLDLDPDYIEYVEHRFQAFIDDLREGRDPYARFRDQNAALSDDR